MATSLPVAAEHVGGDIYTRPGTAAEEAGPEQVGSESERTQDGSVSWVTGKSNLCVLRCNLTSRVATPAPTLPITPSLQSPPCPPPPPSGRRPSEAKLAIDKERLQELKTGELIELLQEYMGNNTALRDENLDLHTLRDALMRDQDVIIKENERLLRKLEEINRSGGH